MHCFDLARVLAELLADFLGEGVLRYDAWMVDSTRNTVDGSPLVERNTEVLVCVSR